MFEQYKDSQKSFYDIITASVINNKKISHAYFIETNGFKESNQLAISFAKFLLCKHNFTNSDKCGLCELCRLIDYNNCLDFKIIEPDGNWIKKEQLTQLQSEFNTKSLINGYRVYIIKEADKLTGAAANSLLKFLEEPEENIIAILLSDNRYNVIDTIISRCQVYQLENKEGNLLPQNDLYVDITYKFLSYVELNGVKAIAHENELLNSVIQTKEQLVEIIPYFGQFYETLLDIILKRNSIHTCFNRYHNDMIGLSEKNSLESLARKIGLIYDLPEKVQFNSNQALLLDKLIIDLNGGVK
ncbi:MAG: hypothetical protein RSA48_01595 [Bacilli bacterium]